jgi:hypothetical protein
MAVNTAKATCSDGKALPPTSVALRNCSAGYCDQSTANTGTVVGKNQNTARPIAAMTAAPRAQAQSSALSFAKAGASEM